MIRLWPAWLVPLLWHQVAGWIEGACGRSGGRMEAADIWCGAVSGRFQIWTVQASGEVCGVVVTELREYPRGRACAVMIVTGRRRREWQDCLDDVMRWARERGCRWFESRARAGWARVFAGTLRQTHVFLETEL